MALICSIRIRWQTEKCAERGVACVAVWMRPGFFVISLAWTVFVQPCQLRFAKNRKARYDESTIGTGVWRGKAGGAERPERTARFSRAVVVRAHAANRGPRDGLAGRRRTTPGANLVCRRATPGTGLAPAEDRAPVAAQDKYGNRRATDHAPRRVRLRPARLALH